MDIDGAADIRLPHWLPTNVNGITIYNKLRSDCYCLMG